MARRSRRKAPKYPGACVFPDRSGVEVDLVDREVSLVVPVGKADLVIATEVAIVADPVLKADLRQVDRPPMARRACLVRPGVDP